MSQATRPHLADDLARAHRAISRALAVAQERGENFVNGGFPDPDSRQGYLDYSRCLLAVMRGHRDVEDSVIFPRLAKIPGLPFERLSSENHRLGALLSAAEGAAEAAAVARFVEVLSEIEDLWKIHIASEDEHLTAEAIDLALTASEQGEMARLVAQDAVRRVKPEFLALPFFLFNLEREDREQAAHRLPPVVLKELVPGPWKEKWAPMKPFLLE